MLIYRSWQETDEVLERLSGECYMMKVFAGKSEAEEMNIGSCIWEIPLWAVL